MDTTAQGFYYHFYENNLYVRSAKGITEAQKVLEELQSRWYEQYDNFWSDAGDVEMSQYPTAPADNYSSTMEAWRSGHPGW